MPVALLLSACGTTPPPPPQASVTTVITTPAQAPAPQILVVTPVQAPAFTSPEALNTQAPALPDVVTALLTYSERLRLLNPTDLAAEIAVQGDPGNTPLRQMQLALALMHMPQAADTARALGLLQRVVGSASPEATLLKPLARLLAHQLMEQRRLEDSLERQSLQLREHQRRIDQLSERLEAMRAIERSLTTRPPAATRTPPP
ncbi:hypothetical protein [Hydrogenophaga sp. PBL-H3]|uniref:hypothetical protein n=1 Tax=Hydrogenophaga sp. PBL-H3 TaxID=434010 RepID=UPI00131F5272|nr:hypothetical protein [Hydrogenophaga sp. PBL-H3]QHE77816.1 hypothetical protein F9Z45_18155 [Hydrogenophaga sp. PBL-H3]QHE82240.1 hypothetical protein F9Z44_18155 [Hydrogenophaga sp. PBL-H3]